ncbi:MAG: NTP transferase domain-containing protein [Leptolyngbya sp.]|nr:NTP transferase domain-containing protein [Candidatus Melainabacteria bacterium]
MTSEFSTSLDVVLMVGGEGARLRPLTNNCPKPMLEVGGIPIVERLLQNLIAVGFERVCFAVYYKAEVIENYFGDGSRWGIAIEYLREETRMGTAGALALLRDKIDKPVLVMNGDLVTEANFPKILEHHMQCKAVATMCAVPFEITAPYGIVELEGSFLSSVREKPLLSAFANAGIYVVSHEAIEIIPTGKPYDMPQLFEQLISNKEKVGAYVINERWSDVGDLSELERVQNEFAVKSRSLRDAKLSIL